MPPRKSPKIVSAWLGSAPSKNTKVVPTVNQNEQQLEGPGGQGGESRGGFDPMMGWNAIGGAALAGIAYAKIRTPRTKIPVQKVRGKEIWTAEEQSNHYASQAAFMEMEAKKMSHPSYFGKVKFNEQDIKIQQIKLMSDADKLRRRANTIARGIPTTDPKIWWKNK